MQMRKLSWDEAHLIYDNSGKGWTPTLISISSRPDRDGEMRTQKWALRDALTRNPPRRKWSETSAPWCPFLEKRTLGFSQGRPYNENLEPAVSIETLWTSACSGNNRALQSRSSQTLEWIQITRRCWFWFSGTGVSVCVSNQLPGDADAAGLQATP